jgi:hypothetical protein
VVAKLDRLSRSLIDFAGLLEDAKRGYNVVALDLGVDLSTPLSSVSATKTKRRPATKYQVWSQCGPGLPAAVRKVARCRVDLDGRTWDRTRDLSRVKRALSR